MACFISQQGPDKSTDLRDYIFQLEDKLLKIQAFKHELPRSILLIVEAIERLKKEIVSDGRDVRTAPCNFDEIQSLGLENEEDVDKKS